MLQTLLDQWMKPVNKHCSCGTRINLLFICIIVEEDCSWNTGRDKKNKKYYKFDNIFSLQAKMLVKIVMIKLQVISCAGGMQWWCQWMNPSNTIIPTNSTISSPASPSTLSQTVLTSNIIIPASYTRIWLSVTLPASYCWTTTDYDRAAQIK